MKRYAIMWLYGLNDRDPEELTRINYIMVHTPEYCLNLLNQMYLKHETPADAAYKYRAILQSEGIKDKTVITF